MRLRGKCKCGAEFEARTTSGSVLADFRVWQAIHNARCYEIKSWNTADDGKLHVVGLAGGKAA